MNIKTVTGLQVKADDSGQVTAVIATLNTVDSDGDVILPGAFQGSQPALISAYGHRSWQGDPPVGRGTVFEKGREAIFEGRFWLDTAAGNETWRVVKSAGDLQEWSFSLEDVVAERGEFEGRTVQFIKSVKVKEVSPVLRGAGVNTRTLAVKDDGMAEVRRIHAKHLAWQEARRFRDAELQRELRAIRRNVALLELGYSPREVPVVEVGPARVPHEVRKAVEATVSFCRSHLKLSARPLVRWFGPETANDKSYRERYGCPEDYGGFMVGENVIGRADRDRNEVWVRADLDVRQAMKTAAHECRHLAQPGHVGTSGYVTNERDARDYEAAFVAAYLTRN